MVRLNLTLDNATLAMLDRYAHGEKRRRATLARELLSDALRQREALERRRKLALDYAHGRADTSALMAELEAAQP